MASQILGNTLSHASDVQPVCTNPFPAQFCGTPRPCPSSRRGSPFPPTRLQKAKKKKGLRAIHFSKSKFSGVLVWRLVTHGTTHRILAHLSRQGQLQRHGKTLPTREVLENRWDGTFVLYN